MKWQIDSAHSSLTVGIKHMMISTVRGRFSGLAGEIDFDPAAPERSRVSLRIPADTIDTGEARRDAHLRSADFFDAAAHPEITFNGDGASSLGSGRYSVTGDLTIRGVTKPATVQVEVLGIVADPRAGQRAAFAATSTIDRREWGLVWNQPIANGVLVGETVKIELDLAAVPLREAVAA